MISANLNLLINDEYAYNHELAIESLKLAVSSFTSPDSMKFWGENKNCGRESDIASFLNKYKFDSINYFNYDVSLNDSSSKAAFAVGKKTYDDFNLVTVVIRGGRYGLEWADNFNIGSSDSDYHTGFFTAAKYIKRQVDFLISENGNKPITKIWITGYSRAGAIANLLAAMYDNEKESKGFQVYAYTFASPKTVIVNNVRCYDKLYGNIFNVLSPNDPIYNIPPKKWGFGRFGICVVLPNNNLSENNNKNTLEKVYEDYRRKTGKTPITQNHSVDTLVNLIVKSSDGRDYFYENLYKPLKDMITLKLLKEKNSEEQWENYPEDKLLKLMYGNEIIDDINKLKSSYFINSLKKIGVNLPDDFYTFISLCRVNGYNGYENLIYNKLNLEEISQFIKISSSDFLYVGHTANFYLSWLENVPLSELEFFNC